MTSEQIYSSTASTACAICLDTEAEQVVEDGLLQLACGHTFHPACLHASWQAMWLAYQVHPICPMCRAEVQDHGLELSPPKQQAAHPQRRILKAVCLLLLVLSFAMGFILLARQHTYGTTEDSSQRMTNPK